MRMFRPALLSAAAAIVGLSAYPIAAQETQDAPRGNKPRTQAINSAEGGAHADSAERRQKAQEMQQKIKESLAKLPADERKLAQEQRFCAVMPHSRLGSMGQPVAVTLEGEKVLLCCEACVETAKNHADKTVETAEALKEANAALAELPAPERRAAEAQKYCAVRSDNLLGSMGKPIKVELDGKAVYLCCEGCVKKAQAEPKQTLKKANELRKAGREASHDHGDQAAAHKE